MNAKHYEKMVLSQLNDTKTYKKLPVNNDFNIARKVADFVKIYKSSFTKQEFECLTEKQVNFMDYRKYINLKSWKLK